MTSTHQRSDAEIFSAARKALDDHPVVPQVRVHVDGGTVTLTGSVRRPQDRSAAEAVVRGINGVLDIINRVLVAETVDPEGFDAPEVR